MAGVKYRIAVIPGDGIGKEVLPEGMRVVEAAGRKFGFACEWTTFDWSCEVYAKTGRMMPFDFVADVTCRFGRVLARSKA